MPDASMSCVVYQAANPFLAAPPLVMFASSVHGSLTVPAEWRGSLRVSTLLVRLTSGKLDECERVISEVSQD